MVAKFCKLLNRFRRDEDGATLIEMTFLTPILIALAAGTFEFGNLYHQKLLVEVGLRDAARYAARCNADFLGIGTADCEARAANIAAHGNIAGNGPARVSGWTAADVTVDWDDTITPVNNGTCDPCYRSTGPDVFTVRVDTSFTYPGSPLLSSINVGAITFTGSHEERYIGW